MENEFKGYEPTEEYKKGYEQAIRDIMDYIDDISREKRLLLI